MRKFLIYFFIFSFIFTVLLGIRADAQQTIFNVPSADVLDPGKAYFELDASFKTNRQDALGRFSSFVPRLVVGVGKNVEVGLNVTGNIQPGTDSTTLVPAVKWRFYKNEKRGVALFAGNHFYIPVRNRAYNFGSHTYIGGAKTFGKTRLTAAGYVASKNVFAPNAVRGGGQFGFEHTVNKYLNINADWYTGKHAAGYFTPGVAFKPHPKVTGYFGYSIGNANAAQGNHFFYAAIGWNIN